MKHGFGALLLPYASVSVPTFANELASDKGQDAQTIKECMAKQKATNSRMTQQAMETVCKNEAKKNKTKDGNDLATGPQTPKEH